MLWAKQYQDAEKVRYRNNLLSEAHLSPGITVEDSLIYSLLNTLPEAQIESDNAPVHVNADGNAHALPFIVRLSSVHLT